MGCSDSGQTKRRVQAHIIFSEASLPWLRWLREGYRHVSVVIPCGEGYLHIDPRSVRIDFRFIKREQVAEMYDRALYKEIIIIEYTADDIREGMHVPAVFTCVEFVKRVIGIRAWWVLTPHQLYKHIRKLKGKELCQSIFTEK